MMYQTINPFTGDLLKEFPEHSDAQLDEILSKAQAVYQNNWRLKKHKETA